MKYQKVIYWNIPAIFKRQPKQLHLIKIKVKETQQTNVTLQTSAWNRCYVGWLSIRYSKQKRVQQAMLSETSSGKQTSVVPENALPFSVFKIIPHTVLFLPSLTYLSDLFFFLEEKIFCQQISLECQRNAKFWRKGFNFYCVVSSLHLESTKSLAATSLKLIRQWEIFEHLLHGCISASLEKGFTMKWLVA